MTYLPETYWIWCLVSLLGGAAIGFWWFPHLYRHPVLAWTAVAIVVGLIAAVSIVPPGQAELYLEALLFLLLGYVAGATLGGWRRPGTASSDASGDGSRIAADGEILRGRDEGGAAIAAERAAEDSRRFAEKAAEDAREAAVKAAEEARRIAEAKAAEDARAAAAAKVAEEARRIAEAKAAEDARAAAAAKVAEEARRAAEAKAAEDARAAAAAKVAEEARGAAEAKAAEDARVAAAAKAAEEARRAAEVKAAEDARAAAAAKAAEEARGAAEAKAAEDARAAAAAKAAEEAHRAVEAKTAGDARAAAEAKAAEAPVRVTQTYVAEDAGAGQEASGAEHPGVKPAGIAEPRNGNADDLKLIKGIGPKNEITCHKLGIYHLSQIADWTAEEARWVGHHMAFPGRIEREHWVDQAKLLAAGGDTDHSAGVKAGTIQINSTADAPLDEADIAALTANLPAQAPSVEGESAHHGRRPFGLLAPRHGSADKLQRIRGIGPQNERRLHALGIWHFGQIAAWSAENVSWVGSYLAFPGRIDREKWIAQAKDLAAGRDTKPSAKDER